MKYIIAYLMLYQLRNFESNEFEIYVEHLGYIGIFLWYTTIDQLTPIPEEVTLLSIGYMAAHNIFNPFIAGGVALFAFILVDLTYYFLSRSGHKFIDRLLRKKSGLINFYSKSLRSNMTRSLFYLCFVPRMRMFGPILVGLLNLPFKKFISTDLAALSIFTAVYVSIGITFYKTLYHFFEELVSVRHVIFLTIIISAVIFFYTSFRKKHGNEEHA